METIKSTERSYSDHSRTGYNFYGAHCTERIGGKILMKYFHIRRNIYSKYIKVYYENTLQLGYTFI